MKLLLNILAICLLTALAPAYAASGATNNNAGNASLGKQLYATKCMACHGVDANIGGPAHRGVFGSRAGSVADFNYSPALKKSRVVWNEKTLDRWLANPEKFIPGQQMSVAVPDPQERQDLIAHLKTLKR